ncbi:MAG: TetR/AcrR family transcriptional regulator [Rothia sp. (in: high G+C Gram-positive bacteria)]|nr:TetR/AcrR family transcriptional regulator [Rothia sp. (in: high G+C Gram-positive bacteria)]
MSTDPRPARSRTALIEAITAVLAAEDADPVNITDIVKRAGVSRPTFYQHFDDLGQLTRAAALEKLSSTFATMDSQNFAPDTPGFTVRFTTAMLTQLRDDAAFYRKVLASAGDSALVAELITFLTHRLLNHSPFADGVTAKVANAESYAQFIAAGVSWTAVRWLGTDFTGYNTPEAMAARLTEMIQAAAY